MRPAVPNYAVVDLDDLPPGHRFRLFFEGWTNAFDLPESSTESANQLATAIDRACKLPESSQSLLQAAFARQRAMAHALDALSWSAVAESPLLIGIGTPHPTENGFRFLDPYGLPVLPGASVKGVVRRAAEELALATTPARRHGWTLPRTWIAFGFDANAGWFRASGHTKMEREGNAQLRKAYENHIERLNDAEIEEVAALLAPYAAEEKRSLRAFLLESLTPNSPVLRRIHSRGALVFFDAYASPPAQRLGTDVLTSHHRSWYTENETPEFGPHDAESPLPVRFLVLPTKTKLEIHVHCDGKTASHRALTAIRNALPDALEHAAVELGFGAKTSAGYGRFTLTQLP